MPSKTTMNDIATSYVKLVLAVGQYDSDYIFSNIMYVSLHRCHQNFSCFR